MFLKKPTYNDPDIGEFTFSGGCWHALVDHDADEKLFVSVVGEKSGLSNESLRQAKLLLSNPGKYVDQAKRYIENQDISDFMKGNGTLILGGIYSHDESGQFDLDFGLSNWDDASITVHFKDYEPVEITLGD